MLDFMPIPFDKTWTLSLASSWKYLALFYRNSLCLKPIRIDRESQFRNLSPISLSPVSILYFFSLASPLLLLDTKYLIQLFLASSVLPLYLVPNVSCFVLRASYSSPSFAIFPWISFTIIRAAEPYHSLRSILSTPFWIAGSVSVSAFASSMLCTSKM